MPLRVPDAPDPPLFGGVRKRATGARVLANADTDLPIAPQREGGPALVQW